MTETKTTAVTIIGAGPAGLACAKELHHRGLDFALISPDIGGKLTYGRGRVPYGSYYVHSSCSNFLPLTTSRRRIWPWQGMAVGENRRVCWKSALMSRSLVGCLKLRKELLKFQQQYERFKVESVEMGPANALLQNPYLMDLYRENGKQFLTDLVGMDSRIFLLVEGNLRGTTFCNAADLSALDVLKYSRNFILPTYTFYFDPVGFSRPFAEHIYHQSVTSIVNKHGTFHIQTSTGEVFVSATVVNATNRSTPIEHVGIEMDEYAEPNVSAYMYHLKGTRTPAFNKYRIYGFSESYDPNLFALTREADGTRLVYAREEDSSHLEAIFSQYEIIGSKSWKCCLTMGADRPVVSEVLMPGYIRAGAMLFEGIEDAWLSGLYAAGMAQKHVRAATPSAELA